MIYFEEQKSILSKKQSFGCKTNVKLLTMALRFNIFGSEEF